MATVRKYTGEDGRYYPYLPLADGTVGWTGEHGATVKIATVDAVPDDGRFDTEGQPKPKSATAPTGAATSEGEQQ